MGTLRDPSTINNVGTLGGSTNPTTAQALPLERENQKAIRELVGTFGYENLTISSGGITPTKAEVTVDTEAGASADDLTTIYLVSDGTTTLHDGMILKLRAYDPARVVTVKHGSGVNQIQTVSGTAIVLGTTWELTLKLQSGVWKEVRGRQDITGNAATATLATTATTANTLKQGGIIAPTSGGTSTAYTVTSSPVVSALTAGNVYQFVAHTACGASPTVNFDGRGAKSIKSFSGGAKVAVAAGVIPAGSLVQCLYDGTAMVMAISGDALPVGTIFDFAGNAAPTGSLIADGAAISRTAYASLFAVLVTAPGFTAQTFTVTIATPAVFTRSSHGLGDGARLRLSTTGALPTGLSTSADYFVEVIDANTFYLLNAAVGGSRINTSGTQSGTHSYTQSLHGLGDGVTTFNIPDLRGEFRRGADLGRGVDAGRAVGSAQGDAIRNITGTVDNLWGMTAPATGALSAPAGSEAKRGATSSNSTFKITLDASTQVPTASENRPRNVTVVSCIKY